MFVRVPKSIIKYSCKENHLLLPMYLYSAIHMNINHDYLVDTNLAHIIETFNPYEDTRKGYHKKYDEVFKLMISGVDDKFSECIELKYPKLENVKNENKQNIQNKQLINKTDRLQYYFLDREINHDGNFIQIDFNEYFYLIDSITDINNNPDTTKKWNLVDLINFYVYLKMQIGLYQYLSKEKDKSIPMRESVFNLSQVMKVGTKTITKYTNELIELGMIEIKVGSFIGNKSTEYYLNNKWREKYER